MAYPQDIANGCIYGAAVTVGNVTQTTTGPVFDALKGDGVVTLLVGVHNGVITSGTVFQVYSSTTTNAGFSAIAAATCQATTSGMVGVAFTRPERYLVARMVIDGTTATGVWGQFIQQKKSVVF